MSVIITGTKWSEQAIRTSNTIFLAGPSKRPTIPFISYRKKFIELAQKEIKDCVIFQPEWNPEAGFGSIKDNTEEIFANSQKWELEAMNDSKVVIIGLDTDADNLGLTTRTELGMLVESRRNLVIYYPPNSFKMSYQVELCRMKGFPICETLEHVIEETKKLLLKLPTVTTTTRFTVFDFNPFVSKLKFNTVIETNYCDPVVLKQILHGLRENLVWCHVNLDDYLNLKLLNSLYYIFHHFVPKNLYSSKKEYLVFCNHSLPPGQG